MEGGSGPESGGHTKTSHDFVMGGMSLHERKKCEAWDLQANGRAGGAIRETACFACGNMGSLVAWNKTYNGGVR